MTSSFIEKSNRINFTKRVVVLTIATLFWFIIGTFIIESESIPKDKLKIISGELTNWSIVNITGSRRNIDVLTFNIKNHTERVALYLNSIDSYKPLTEKLEKGKRIDILYNERGHSVKEGYNLHVYEIKFENQILLDYNKKTRKGKNVGLVLYGLGLPFGIALILTLKKRKQKRNN